MMNEAIQSQTSKNAVNEKDLFLDLRAGLLQVASALTRYARHQQRPALALLGNMIKAAANVIAAHYGIPTRE